MLHGYYLLIFLLCFVIKGGASNLKVGGGVNSLEGGGQYSKNNKLLKSLGVHES